MMRCSWALVLSLALGSTVFGQDGELSAALFPGAIPIGESGRTTHAVTCIVDAATGDVIPGARMVAVAEVGQPLSGVFWSTREVTADADGFVRMPVEDLESPWLYFMADGYAPRADLTRYPDPVIRLEQAVDVSFVVRDALDRPIGGAQVGWLIGCGHTPDVRVAIADATGRGVLPGIGSNSGELWPVADGIYSDYADVPTWQVGDAPVRIRCEPGAIIEGVVVDRDGRPVVGHFVGAPHCHRGPWVKTDDRGRFRLVGADPDADVLVRSPDAEDRLLGVFFVTPGVKTVLVVPQEEGAPRTLLHVQVVDRAEPDAAPDVPIRAVRLSDGFTELTSRTDIDGIAELELLPGRYTVTVGGGFSGFDPVDLTVDVGTKIQEKRVVLTRSPRIALEVGELPEGVDVDLVTSERVVAVDLKDREPLAVPRTGDLALRVTRHERVVVTSIPPERRDPARSIEVELPAPVEVRARLVAPDGTPVAGWIHVGRYLAVDDSDLVKEQEAVVSSDQPTRLTWARGTVYVVAVPVDDRYQARRLRVTLPEPPLELDAGVIRLADSRDAPRLLVLLEDGEPAAGLDARLRFTGGWANASLDRSGCWKASRVPDTGYSIEVERDGWLSLRATLRGDAPWTLKWHPTEVAIAAVDAADTPIDEFVICTDDGRVIEAEKGSRTLRGLAPGTRRLIVAAPGRLARVFDVEVAANEPLQLRAVLPTR